jgi:uncharacterized Zn-binding protein involved in type VI secretion
MPPAARIGDLTAHLGALVQGEPTVLIGGAPASRLCDMQVCPMADPKPHVIGAVTESSKTVMIGGKLAARQFDRCDCTVAGMCGVNVPGVVGPSGPWQWSTKKDASGKPLMNKDLDNDGGSGPHLEIEADGSSTDDGVTGTVRGEGHLGRGRVQGTKAIGGGEINYQGEGDLMAREAQVQGGSTGYTGAGGTAQTQATGAKVAGKVSLGPAGDAGNNPYLEVGASATGGSGEARADMLVGDDGNRVGLAAGGKAEVGGAVGQVTARETIPLWGDYNIQVAGYGEGKWEEFGGGMGGQAYYDKSTQRFNLGGFAGLDLWAGAELGFNISIGKKIGPPPPAPPAIPNTIITGWLTVLIGD